MRDLFLADAHLRDPADANYRKLLDFLAAERGRIRTLYILGDLFEFWVGYRHTVFAPYVPLLEALRRLREAGTEIVYVEGNHDFHLGPYFREVLACRVLPDGGTVSIDGRRVHLSHGDLVNPADHGYRLLRRLLRSLPLRLLLRLLPPDAVWAIARWGSRQSKKSHGRKRTRWVPRELLLRHARQRFDDGCRVVVTGHFHAPLLEEEAGGTVVALGDWIEQYSYAVCEDGIFTLHSA